MDLVFPQNLKPNTLSWPSSSTLFLPWNSKPWRPRTLAPASKLKHVKIRSEFDGKVNGALSNDFDPRFLDRQKALEAAMNDINSSFGKGSVTRLGSAGGALVETFPSGCLTLDFALGGGLPRGRIVEIFGPESSGKTTLALHAIAEVQKLGGNAMLVDAEHAFDPAYSKALGVDVENLIVCQPDHGEMALEIADRMCRSGAIDLICVDSVSALTPRAEIEGEIGMQQMGLQARLMSQALRKMSGNASKAGCTLIFLNQIRYKIGVYYGNPEVTSGGIALKFFASVRLEIRSTGKIKSVKGDEEIGLRVRVRVQKSKVSRPYKQAEFEIIFGEGVSNLGCILDCAEMMDVVVKKGSWYSYEDHRLGLVIMKLHWFMYRKNRPFNFALIFLAFLGDLGGTTEHDEVGGDKDLKHRDGLPNSPTSSGQQPPNPLQLLGQYSDEEFDEEPNKGLNHDEEPSKGLNLARVESSSPTDEVKHSLDEDHKDVDVSVVEDLIGQKVKQEEKERESVLPDVSLNLEGSDKREIDPTISADLQQEMDLTEQNSISETSDVQVISDVTLGWKIVMHEESNRYYYWNTETGETSWEVPDVLAGATGLTNGQTTPTITEIAETAPVVVEESDITSSAILDGSSAAHLFQGTMDANMIPHGMEVYGHTYQTDDCSQAYKTEAWKDSSWSTVINSRELGAGSEKYTHEPAVDHSFLVKQSECLLERLKSFQGSNDHLQGQDLISKYIWEIEIRLSDLKSLSSYGSSLLPFWVHSEKQLKRLESAINDEIYKIAVSAHMEATEATHVSTFSGKDKLPESMGYDSEADGTENKNVLSTSEQSDVAPYVDASTGDQKDPCDKVPFVDAEHVSSFGSPTRGLGSGAEVSEQVNGAQLGDESTHKHGFNAAEDVDMDVDMEVEDATSSGNTNTVLALNPVDFAPSEHLIQNPPAEIPSLISEDGFTVPPPPDDEWIPPPPPDNEHIPPPPPDNEHIPPPPPDEPPEPSYPPLPSYTETRQPISYTDQYNLLYPDSSFEYHGHTVAQVPSSSLYGQAEGSQVAVPHAPIYYDTVPTTYSDTAVIVNSVEPVAYYQFQDGTVPSVPVGSGGVEATLFQSVSAPVSYDTLPSEQIVSVDPFMEVGHNSSLNLNVNSSAIGGETETNKASIEVPSTSATIQAPATTSVKESVSVPPTDTVAATSVGNKVQSKALRNKKRSIAAAPSLRSNKKVSSLVDKWKAAKEELLEDEKEPEDPYEILERKRQREIEQWHARQIASGEAKDNANFQPLGGDWRERVKRRRAQLAKASAKTKAHTDGNQQPDLIELSRDLPSGWQAYLDESSKQVYYGNTDTSETTWTRPTK